MYAKGTTLTKKSVASRTNRPTERVDHGKSPESVELGLLLQQQEVVLLFYEQCIPNRKDKVVKAVHPHA